MFIPPLWQRKRPSVLGRAQAAWKSSRYSGSGALLDITGNGFAGQLGSTSGADANDPLWLTGGPYLYLPGTAGNNATAPDAAALDIVGDIDLRAAVALTDWTPAAAMRLVGKWLDGGNRSYLFDILATGELRLSWTTDGTTAIQPQSTVAPVIADGEILLVRVNMDVNDGSGNRVIVFYTKATTYAAAYVDLINNTGWVQLGATITTAGTTSIFAGTALLELGTSNGGADSALMGKLAAVAVFNGINDTLVFGADFTSGSRYNATLTSFTANTGQTVTINRTTAGRKSSVPIQPIFLFGVDDYIEVADNAALNFGATDSFTVIVVIRQYATPLSSGAWVAKRGGGAGYILRSSTTTLVPQSVIEGTGSVSRDATVFVAGAKTTIALRRNVSADTLETGTDGAFVSSPDTTTGSLTNALPLRIGARSDATLTPQEFELIGAAIFRSALSATDYAIAAQQLGTI